MRTPTVRTRGGRGLTPTIVHVAPYYPPHLGGVERVAHALASRSAARHPVEVLTSAVGTDETASGSDGPVLVRRFPAIELAHTPLPVFRLLRRLLTLPPDAIVHVHIAHALWPDLVVLAARLRGFRVVAHFHLDVDPTGRAGVLLPAYKKHVLRRSLQRADAVITLTDQQAADVTAKYGIRPERLRVIGNGVDEAFTAIAAREERAGEALRVLFVGRLERQKNVPRLLGALGRMTAPVEAVVVGDGEDAKACQELAATISDRVRLVGAAHGSQLLDWFAWADVFVLPSDREGMPLALLEAMASGLAIVSTDVSDLREQVGDAGLLTAPDEVAFAAALDRLATDRALLADLKQRSRVRGSSYAWDPIVAEVEALYAGLSP